MELRHVIYYVPRRQGTSHLAAPISRGAIDSLRQICTRISWTISVVGGTRAGGMHLL